MGMALAIFLKKMLILLLQNAEFQMRWAAVEVTENGSGNSKGR